jgi:hypothetical protein
MSELTVLQAIQLKGRVSPADLAATLDTNPDDPDDTAGTVERLTADGLLIDGPALRISPNGRQRLSALLAEERTNLDTAAMAAAYDEFRSINTDFKRLVTDWQLKAGQPNTHDDSEYDAAIVARLDRVHQKAVAIVAAAATQLPRLSPYSVKLQTALAKVKAGETAWLTRPLIDSYHTVWFELHEELILAVGLTREEAARSGDAQ